MTPVDPGSASPWEQARRAVIERRRYDLVPFEQPLPSVSQRSPDFLVIGAQKAGTTWLHDNLLHHPEIWLPPAKELHYFSLKYAPSKSGWERSHLVEQLVRSARWLEQATERQDVLKRRRACLAHLRRMGEDDEWYRGIFAFAGCGQVAGEMSTWYSVLPRQAVSAVVGANPLLRAILILRDPIDRAWSHLRMHLDRKDPSAELLMQNVTLNGLWPYISMSNYGQILRNWSAALAPDRFLVLNFDDIATHPEMLLERVTGFLGLTFDPRLFEKSRSKIHGGVPLALSGPVYDALREALFPVYQELERYVPEMSSVWRERHYRGD